MSKLNALAAGYAGAVISALAILLLALLGKLGFYMGAVKFLEEVHMFFSLSLVGIIGGVIEAAVFGFVFTYIFVWFYNRFV